MMNGSSHDSMCFFSLFSLVFVHLFTQSACLLYPKTMQQDLLIQHAKKICLLAALADYTLWYRSAAGTENRIMAGESKYQMSTSIIDFDTKKSRYWRSMERQETCPSTHG